MASGQLTISGFLAGLLSETTITKTGIANPQGDLGGAMTIANCPCTDVLNMDYYPRGTFESRFGYEIMNYTPWHGEVATGGVPIMRMYQWQSISGVDYLLCFSAVSGSVSADIATFTSSGGSGAFVSRPISSAEGSGWSPTEFDSIDVASFAGSAFFTYGNDILPIFEFSGETYCEPLTAAPSGAKCIAAWGNFLFVGNIMEGGVRHRSRIRWCYPGNPNSWPSQYYIDLDYEDGDEISCIWVLKDVIVVFKKYKIFVVRWVGGVLMFDWERKDNEVGALGPQNTIEYDGELYFIGYQGFYKFNGYAPAEYLSEPIEPYVAQINVGASNVSEIAYYESKNQLWFAVPHGSSEIKNRVYTYDPDLKGWGILDLSISSMASVLYGETMTFADLPEAYETYETVIGDAGGAGDSFLGLGSYDGYVRRFGFAATDNGVQYDAYWVSPWIDFGDPNRNKRLLRGTLFVDTSLVESDNINIDIMADWEDTTVVYTATKSIYNSNINKETIEMKLDFTLPIRAFKFKIYTNQSGCRVRVHKAIFEYMVKGMTFV